MSTRRPRYRYIAFRVDGPRPFRRDEVLAALHALPSPLWLVGFEDPKGLARCTHLRKDETVAALNGMHSIADVEVRVTTLGASGTIRRATEKYLSGTRRPSHRRPKEAL